MWILTQDKNRLYQADQIREIFIYQIDERKIVINGFLNDRDRTEVTFGTYDSMKEARDVFESLFLNPGENFEFL